MYPEVEIVECEMGKPIIYLEAEIVTLALACDNIVVMFLGTGRRNGHISCPLHTSPFLAIICPSNVNKARGPNFHKKWINYKIDEKNMKNKKNDKKTLQNIKKHQKYRKCKEST